MLGDPLEQVNDSSQKPGGKVMVKNLADGGKLLEKLRNHVIRTMRTLPECTPKGSGARSKEIERAARLDLQLTEHDGWLTWSLLMSLAEGGNIKIMRRGKRRIRYFRLK